MNYDVLEKLYGQIGDLERETEACNNDYSITSDFPNKGEFLWKTDIVDIRKMC